MEKKEQVKGRKLLGKLCEELDSLTVQIAEYQAILFKKTTESRQEKLDKIIDAELKSASLAGFIEQWHHVQDLVDSGKLYLRRKIKLDPKKLHLQFPVGENIVEQLREINLRALTEQLLVISDYEMEWTDKEVQPVIQKHKSAVLDRIQAFRLHDHTLSRARRSSSQAMQKIINSKDFAISVQSFSIQPSNIAKANQLSNLVWSYSGVYGNHCGILHGRPDVEAIDCLDEACKKHDECKQREGLISTKCEAEFYQNMWACDLEGADAQIMRVLISIAFVPITIVEAVIEFLAWLFGGDDDTLRPALNYGPEDYWIHLRCYDKINFRGDRNTLVVSGKRQHDCQSLRSHRGAVKHMRSVRMYDQRSRGEANLPAGMKVYLYWGRRCPSWKPYGVITVPANTKRIEVPRINHSSTNYQVYNNFNQSDGGDRRLNGHVYGFRWHMP